MRTRLLTTATLSLALAACVTEHASVDAVQGSWTLDDGSECTSAFTFDGVGEYAVTYACPMSTGTLGVEMWRGTYTLDGDNLTLLTTDGSCGNATWGIKYEREQTLQWRVAGDTLELSSGPNSIALERMADGDWLAGSVTGCWSSDREFVPGAVEPWER